MDQDATATEIVDWASGDDNIRAVVLTGSAARAAGDTDALSDLDVELYVRDPDVLLDHDAWQASFGHVLAVEALPNQGWNPTRLLYLVDGKIDFTIVHVDEARRVLHPRPFRVLLDRDGVAASMTIDSTASHPPDATQFSECGNWFYAAALMEAKLLVREQMWQAKFREWDLLCQLLRMIEWDHKARYGWDYDTWYNGKNIDRWADSDIRSSVRACWSVCERADMQRALRASTDLFITLESRTAMRLGLDRFDHDAVGNELERLLALGAQR